MVLVARYNEEFQFKIPLGVDLDDETQVRYWGLCWNTLRIKYTDGREEEIDAFRHFEPDPDPDWFEQMDLDGAGACEEDFDEEIEEYRDALEAKKEPFFFNLAIKKVKRSKIYCLGLAMKIDMMRCGLLLAKM